MSRLIILACCLSCLLLTGCNQSKELDNVTKFSPSGSGDYLLFHLIDPFKKEGYISEVKNNGDVVCKHRITDEHFAPSDVFQYKDNFYFASGAYSNDSKVMKYSPTKRELSFIETNQEKFIEKYYKDNTSEYIVTVSNKDNQNEVCDIRNKKCVRFPDSYIAHDVTSLNNYVIVVGVDQNAMSNKDKVVLIKKLNRNLEVLEETTLDILPNYFTYTSQNQKLYLFLTNGDIAEIDSDLNVNLHSVNLSPLSKNIEKVLYNKNIILDKNNILINIEIQEPNKSSNFLSKISFENDKPKLEMVKNSGNEDILNVDIDHHEVYTRSYIDNKSVIIVRDINTLKVKNKLKLKNNDPIYFVDNIKK